MKSFVKHLEQLAYLIFGHICLSLVCGIMLWSRIYYTHKVTFIFLFWNIFLAWIPFVLAILIRWLVSRTHRLSWKIYILMFAWLLFLPNAPYVVTDFVHLSYVAWYQHAPVWFDVILLMSFAVHGLLLGFSSLYIIHQVLKKYYTTITSWLIIISCIVLTSFGMYLGRFLRWNSWDIIQQPMSIVLDVINIIIHPLAEPRAIIFTLLYFAFLSTSYVCVYGLTRLGKL